ncbi:hypothetical protein GXP70_12270 [Paenibacillus lycopersici]|uniref:Copper amine oxidase-like N-terminal domain-containing protein n=2 Tax=Paenibacillus lycopersici TaxID=2704462 RepID=A0A6C0G820_9BACL|nr:hypothetical protein GXP70_12270 [Paenibacillus lycopersici]
MIPIYLLKYAGINYTWDQSNQTVNIVTSKNATTTPTTPQVPVATLDYPLLYSNDGKTYLGKLTTNKFDSESVFNEFGDYGSSFSKTSIWNEFGTYGGEFSNQSPFNKFATKPPIIIQNKKVVAYLSVNTTLGNVISPNTLYDTLKNNGF